jgi:signal peptidase II
VSARTLTVGWRAAYLAAAALLYLVDQMTKAWAVRRLRLGETVRVVEGFLHFGYAENTGIAFGQLQEGGEFGRWMLAALAALAAVGVLVYFFRVKGAEDRVLGACALLLAGIAGNLTDRIRLGHVVDFVEVHLGSYQWPTFNVADAAICVGAGLLALDLILEGKRESGRKEAVGEKT